MPLAVGYQADELPYRYPSLPLVVVIVVVPTWLASCSVRGPAASSPLLLTRPSDRLLAAKGLLSRTLMRALICLPT